MKGAIHKILEEIYKYKNLNNSEGETKKRIIRIRLSLKTGLSMNNYTVDSEDLEEDICKITEALKSPEFGLKGISFFEG